MVSHRYVVKKAISNNKFLEIKPQLRRLDIELTERCNNACIHCYINLPANDCISKQNELTTNQWKDVMKQAVDLGAHSVRITGGEPLLREDFVELYLFARALGLKVTIFTNGRLITRELADLFVEVPPLKKIEISVYGMKPESYDAVACTPGAFVEFRRGVKYLLDRQIPFIVKSILLPPNRGELSEFEVWAATIPGMDIKPSNFELLTLRARRDSQSKNKLINKLRIAPEEYTSILSRDEQSYFDVMTDYCLKFMHPPGEFLFSCGAGASGCVDPYGNIQMCILLRHPDTVCNLSRNSIREAYAQLFPRVRNIKASNPEYLNRCARCFLMGLCEQCPAKSWMENGTLDTPVEYLCDAAHSQARHLGLINDNEQAWEVGDWQNRLALMNLKKNTIGR